jgi:tripartite-type tricarboxylate transporter receptor subunit TctC
MAVTRLAISCRAVSKVVRKRLRDQGVEPPPPGQRTPEAFAAFHKAEVDKWWPFIKAAGIRTE